MSGPGPGGPAALVLGGTGYLGRAVCAGLRDTGHRVVALARRAGPVPADCTAVPVDLSAATTPELRGLLARFRPSLVVNAAGALWEVTDRDMERANTEAVRRLVGALGEVPGRRPRLVHLGTVYEYGTPDAGRAAVDENTPERPTTPYGRTKLAGTRIVTEAVAAGRIDARVLRLSTVIGPHAPRGSLFGMLAARLRARPDVLGVPELEGRRDLVDLRDVVDAVLAAARTRDRTPVLNIAAGRLVPLERAVRDLVRISGVPVECVPQPRRAPRRGPGGDSRPIGIEAARRALGWTPRRTLHDSLAALWEGSNEVPSLL
ncbi:NAD(P)-dependent oxidoreductase [Streptomyces sp. MST-110588]|uniref:NAD-dependent epimerase/dehydratase family protein n=1 Tax=Streptomyces sp. MST-110588 TaxID=2833628 RepID=UPI001F5C3224|nr:NAD(P)-dependent oxidoreductase [Streptomyces sp. MST-110588]UNO40773.1 NAD-dependent epimerase/dehydratase family protein [Streptomyces sp. MST-110588]